MKGIIWFFQVAVFYCCTLAFAFIPAGLIRPVGCFTGRLGGILIAKRRRVAVENIRLALPFMTNHPDWNGPSQDPEELARMMFCHLGMSFVETCRLYHGRGKEALERIEIRGWEHLEAAKARGKGVIVLTGHCGNWELAALTIPRRFNSAMSVVARRQNNPYLNKMVEKMRLNYGNQIIYKNNALKNMLTVIRKNGLIGLLADQAAFPKDGALIDFLGRKAWATKAPVLVARRSGTAVVPAFIHREADRHVIEMHPELVFSDDTSEEGVALDVQNYSRTIEDFVVRHPVDWYWVHRRWKRAENL